MSGFEITRMSRTSRQPPSVHRSQIVLPCWRCSANQTSAECCLGFTMAIECFMDRLGQLFPLPRRRLVTNLAHWGIESSRVG